MVDILALAISHGLLLLAAWRLLWRPELDSESPGAGSPPRRGPRPQMRVNRPIDEDAAADDGHEARAE